VGNRLYWFRLNARDEGIEALEIIRSNFGRGHGRYGGNVSTESDALLWLF